MIRGAIRGCAVCGTQAGAATWKVWDGPGVSLALAVCQACQREPEAVERLNAWLSERYGQQP